jgi:hypothetical protein
MAAAMARALSSVWEFYSVVGYMPQEGSAT